MNTIVLMGRLARDPETKLASTQKGQTKVSRFPLVVKRNRTSKAFVVMITAYGNNAEFVEKYLEKGIKIALSGELVISQIKWRLLLKTKRIGILLLLPFCYH
jgi:single-strand DNA-binding protein